MRLADRPDGIHHDVPAHEYHERVPAIISHTAINKFRYTPATWKAWLDGKDDDSDSEALAFGSAFHCALLEPEVFARTYVAEPDFGACRKDAHTTSEEAKRNKEERNKWRAANVGKRFISPESEAKIAGMCASVRGDDLASALVTGGVPEMTVLWRDSETGLRCKARADYYVRSARLIVDVKTVDSAKEYAFARSVERYGYDTQDALYTSGFAAAGHPVDRFVFLAVEKRAPYLVAMYRLDVASREAAGAAVREAIRGMAECLRTDVYPGHPAGIQTIGVRRWAA